MFESKVLVAFDKGSVRAAVLGGGARGGQVIGEAVQPLPDGALVPGALDDNIAEPAAVRDALLRLRRELGGNGKRASLILPEGVAKLLLLESPPGVAPLEFARFRMAQGLPYAAGEALIDGLPAPPGGFLAAAVRRAVVRSYEAVAAEAGFVQDGVQLQAFAALGPLLAQAETLGTLVAAVLGESAFSLASFEDGRLRLVRQRRRDAGASDEARLRDEIVRTSVLAGGTRTPRSLVIGAGSVELAAALRGAGCDAVSSHAWVSGYAQLGPGVAAS